MKLELATFRVRDVVFSDATRFSDGVLYVQRSKIVELVTEDHRFAGAEVHLVRPGESARLINVLDAVEPRYKVSGPGAVFPGVLGPPVTVGQGRTHRLANLVVMVTSEPVPNEPVYWRDAILDMSGPGADYNLFSTHLILAIEMKPRLTDTRPEARGQVTTNHAWGPPYVQEHNINARAAGFRVASYLAESTSKLAADEVSAYELGPADDNLPKVACSSQLLLHHLYGQALGWQPTFLHPNELMDGCLFNPYNSPACGRESTYFFQNHPVTHLLYGRHNREINFFGMLLLRSQVISLEDKERTTRYAAKLLRMMGIEGLILNWSGSGNPGMDTMMLARRCEQVGIKTTVINSEMALTQGDSGIVYFPSEVDAVVCAGNYMESIALPSVKRLLGGRKINEPEMEASGPLSLPLRYLYGATNVTGANRLSSLSY